jgi:hypothetical protein
MFKIQYIKDANAIQKLNKLIKTKLFDKTKFSSILHNIYNEEKDAFTTIKTITTIIAGICYEYEDVDAAMLENFDTNITSFNGILADAVKKLHTAFSIRKKSLASTSNLQNHKPNTPNTRKFNKRHGLRKQSKNPSKVQGLRSQSTKPSKVQGLRRQSKKKPRIFKPYRSY